MIEAVAVNGLNGQNNEENKDPELEDLLLEGNDILAEIENYEKNLDTAKLLNYRTDTINELNNTNVNDFIEFLTYEQLTEVSNDILELFNINYIENEKKLNNTIKARDQNTVIST